MASSLFQNSQSIQINQNVLNQAKQIMNNTSNISEVMKFLGGKNMDAEAMVRMICRQKGIDVDAFMAQLNR